MEEHTNEAVPPNIDARLKALEARVEEMHALLEKMHRAEVVRTWIAVLFVVLPALGLAVAIPAFIRIYTGALEGLL